MRITRERLKKLIKEEFGRMSEEEGIPGAPPKSLPGEGEGETGPINGGPQKVDVAGTLAQVKQALITGGAAEDQYLSAILEVIAALITGTNIATDSVALRVLGLLKDRAAKLG